MRLLFDQNLSDRLLRILADEYPESIHVRHVGLGRADDDEVWRYALDNGLTITSRTPISISGVLSKVTHRRWYGFE